MIRDSTRASHTEPPIISLITRHMSVPTAWSLRCCFRNAVNSSHSKLIPRQAVAHLTTDRVAFGYLKKIRF
jgi:hypothetical protein